MSRPDRRRPGPSRRARPARAGGEAAFTLIELLVAIAILAVAFASFTILFLVTSYQRRDANVRLELAHGIRSGIEAITSDARLAGACLPIEVGPFVALSGTNGGRQDTLTVVMGAIDRTTFLCTQTTLPPPGAAAGAVGAAVASTAGFAAGGLAYLLEGNALASEIVTIADVSPGHLRFAAPLAADYPTTTGLASTVYGVERRTYSIETSALSRPYLAVAIGAAAPVPLAAGIDELDVRYRLDDGSVVELPADPAAWRRVEELIVTLHGALQRPGGAPGEVYERTLTLTAKPRNFLH